MLYLKVYLLFLYNGDKCPLLAITYYAYQYNHSEALGLYEW